MLLMADLQKNYVPSKTKDVNVKVFHIKRINKVKTLVKHISCDCKCKCGSTTCNLYQKRNNDKCQCVCKKYNTCYCWNPNTCICKNSRYLKSIVYN